MASLDHVTLETQSVTLLPHCPGRTSHAHPLGPQDRQPEDPAGQARQRGLAGSARLREGPADPHQREGGAAEGDALHQPPEVDPGGGGAAGDGPEAAGEGPAGSPGHPEQGADREVGLGRGPGGRGPTLAAGPSSGPQRGGER